MIATILLALLALAALLALLWGVRWLDEYWHQKLLDRERDRPPDE